MNRVIDYNFSQFDINSTQNIIKRLAMLNFPYSHRPCHSKYRFKKFTYCMMLTLDANFLCHKLAVFFM